MAAAASHAARIFLTVQLMSEKSEENDGLVCGTVKRCYYCQCQPGVVGLLPVGGHGTCQLWAVPANARPGTAAATLQGEEQATVAN